MPYIKMKRRNDLSGDCPLDGPRTAGELNFILTDAIKGYLVFNELSYQSINDIVGALEGAKLEFYRRVVVPYEDTKIKENGDVY